MEWVCVIPWKQADTVHGFQQWQDRCWQVVTWPPSMSTTDGAWRTDTFSCCYPTDRHSLGSAQNCLGPTGLQRSVCTLGAKKIPQLITKLIVWAFLVSIWLVTLIKESSFGAETWLITQNLNPEKGCVIEKLSSPFSKENGSILINMCLFWISLTIVTLSADCYCGTLSLWWPFCAKGLGYFAAVLSFCMQMPGFIQPTGQRLWLYICHIMDQSQYCAQYFISHWILEKHLAGKWLQQMLMWSKLSPLGYRHPTAVSLPWNISLGTIVGQMPRW